jgi:hypothetical protein
MVHRLRRVWISQWVLCVALATSSNSALARFSEVPRIHVPAIQDICRIEYHSALGEGITKGPYKVYV